MDVEGEEGIVLVKPPSVLISPLGVVEGREENSTSANVGDCRMSLDVFVLSKSQIPPGQDRAAPCSAPFHIA